MKKKSTHQTQLLIPCMSPRETRTTVDLWPTTGNVTIQTFFLLMIDVFAMYTGNKWADTLVYSESFAQTSRLMMCTWFHCRVLSFSCHGWLHSRMCLCDQLFIKVLGLVTQTGLSWTCIFGWMPERKHVLYGSGWGRTWMTVPDLSRFCSVHIFSCRFCSISLLPKFLFVPNSILPILFFKVSLKYNTYKHIKVYKLWVYPQWI